MGGRFLNLAPCMDRKKKVAISAEEYSVFYTLQNSEYLLNIVLNLDLLVSKSKDK